MEDDLKHAITEIKRELEAIKASVQGVRTLAWTTLAFVIGTILSRVF